ncbi:MAG: VWA domain-containing protein, partial [Pseudoxanthomonas sp.]
TISLSDIVLSSATTVTSGGATVAWTWDSDTNTLTGTVDSDGDGTDDTTVMTISVDSVADNGDGTYTVTYTTTLDAAIDHSDTTSEDTAALSFTVSVTDDTSGTTGTGTLTVNVVDDAPVAASSVSTASVEDTTNYVMIVLDISGSMNSNGGIEAARAAIIALLEAYAAAGGTTEVMIVLFNGLGTLYSATTGWTDVDDLLADDAAAITAITTSSGSSTSGTNYDAALAEAMAVWESYYTSSQDSANKVLYFLTDGTANTGDGNSSALSNAAGSSSDSGISTAEAAIWQAFLEEYGITAYALGMGSSATTAAISSIASDSSTVAVVTLDDTSALADVLVSLVTTAGVSSNLVTGDLDDTTAGFGADGGSLSILTVDGVSYAYDSSTSELTVTDASGSTVSSGYSYDSSTHELTITDTYGGTLVVDLDTGDYTYTPDSDTTSGYTETLGVTVVDADGDSATGTMTLYVATNNDDSFTWDGTAGTLDGGDGSDTVTLSGVTTITGDELAATLTNIETLALGSDTETVAVTDLTAEDVLEITGASSASSAVLTIDGDSNDSVELGGSSSDWTESSTATDGYYTFTNTDGAKVLIDEDIVNNSHVTYTA